MPSFLAVLDVILSEMMVEAIIVADQIHDASESILAGMLEVLAAHGMNPKVTEVSHYEFKVLTASTKAVVRTGECTPYANVILKSGVAF